MLFGAPLHTFPDHALTKDPDKAPHGPEIQKMIAVCENGGV
jgi:hypothetical protein